MKPDVYSDIQIKVMAPGASHFTRNSDGSITIQSGATFTELAAILEVPKKQLINDIKNEFPDQYGVAESGRYAGNPCIKIEVRSVFTARDLSILKHEPQPTAVQVRPTNNPTPPAQSAPAILEPQPNLSKNDIQQMAAHIATGMAISALIGPTLSTVGAAAGLALKPFLGGFGPIAGAIVFGTAAGALIDIGSQLVRQNDTGNQTNQHHRRAEGEAPAAPRSGTRQGVANLDQRAPFEGQTVSGAPEALIQATQAPIIDIHSVFISATSSGLMAGLIMAGAGNVAIGSSPLSSLKTFVWKFMEPGIPGMIEAGLLNGVTTAFAEAIYQMGKLYVNNTGVDSLTQQERISICESVLIMGAQAAVFGSLTHGALSLFHTRSIAPNETLTLVFRAPEQLTVLEPVSGTRHPIASSVRSRPEITLPHIDPEPTCGITLVTDHVRLPDSTPIVSPVEGAIYKSGSGRNTTFHYFLDDSLHVVPDHDVIIRARNGRTYYAPNPRLSRLRPAPAPGQIDVATSYFNDRGRLVWIADGQEITVHGTTLRYSREKAWNCFRAIQEAVERLKDPKNLAAMRQKNPYFDPESSITTLVNIDPRRAMSDRDFPFSILDDFTDTSTTLTAA